MENKGIQNAYQRFKKALIKRELWTDFVRISSIASAVSVANGGSKACKLIAILAVALVWGGAGYIDCLRDHQ